jgi:hypothetical protein
MPYVPYQNRFINFVSIAPKAITATNKLAFDATSHGDMEIEVPLGNGRSSKVLLKDVLYAKDMGMTLVSISCITAAGHKAIIDGPYLKIFNSTRKLLGEIPVSKGLYCVEHTESAHTAMETVTVNDLHCRIGHIAPDAMKLLVKKGIIEGIHLKETQSICTCVMKVTSLLPSLLIHSQSRLLRLRTSKQTRQIHIYSKDISIILECVVFIV